MWLELVPILHRCHAQLAEVRQIPQGRSTVLPCYCIAWHSHVLPWKFGATSLLVACATVGRVGHYIFSRSAIYLRDAASRSLRCSRPTLEPHSVGRSPGGSCFPPVQAQRRRSLMSSWRPFGISEPEGISDGGVMTPPWDSMLMLNGALSP